MMNTLVAYVALNLDGAPKSGSIPPADLGKAMTSFIDEVPHIKDKSLSKPRARQ